MIRVALLDDHPAVRAGLQAILANEHDLQLVGFAADEHALWPVLEGTRPAIIVLDLHHPGRDGLALCLQIKRQPDSPAVLLYSAQASAALARRGGRRRRRRDRQQIQRCRDPRRSDPDGGAQPTPRPGDLAADEGQRGGKTRSHRPRDPRDARRRRLTGRNRADAPCSRAPDCETHRRDRLEPGTRSECSVTFVLTLLLTLPRTLSTRSRP